MADGGGGNVEGRAVEHINNLVNAGNGQRQPDPLDGDSGAGQDCQAAAADYSLRLVPEGQISQGIGADKEPKLYLGIFLLD
jgi:hypothetical protein